MNSIKTKGDEIIEENEKDDSASLGDIEESAVCNDKKSEDASESADNESMNTSVDEGDDDGPPMIIKKKKTSSNKNIVYSCRAFYFTIYGLYYFCAFYYPSQLSKALRDGDYFYFIYIIAVHLGAVFFFMTAGNDPGWADEHLDSCVPSDQIDAMKPPTMAINNKKEFVMKAHDSSIDHLKLSSEEEDSADDSLSDSILSPSPKEAHSTNVEKRARAKKSLRAGR